MDVSLLVAVKRRCVAYALGVSIFASLAAAADTPKQAVLLEIDGPIGPAIANYVVRELGRAKPPEQGIVILRMNTPGGLDTSMREIIRAILASPAPVIAYVAPSGARAASAGTYISYASALAVMAPGTNLGAATPIQIRGLPLVPSGKPDQSTPEKDGQGKEKSSESNSRAVPDANSLDTESRKAINDAVAYIRSLAELNGRNADWAEQAVRAAVSLPASEALKLHVIDVIADDIPDLLRKIDGRIAIVAGKSTKLSTTGLTIVSIAPDWRTELLAIITNPNIAFILMLIGVYGLIFEFLNPGAIAPGLIGGISLLVALFALNLLPINYAGAGLVLLGIGLMVAEAHIGAFGAIGVGGIVAFVIGAVMMFPLEIPGFTLSLSIIAAVTGVTAILIMLVLSLLLRSRRRPVITGKEALIGAEGETVAWQGDEGRVRVMGEIWHARATHALQPGTRIRVINRDGLILKVESA